MTSQTIKIFSRGVLSSVVMASLTFSLASQGATNYSFKNANVGFTAVGKPGFLRITGEGGKANGKVTLDGTKQLLSADVEVKLEDLTTGLSLRDHHMKEKYLQVTSFPTAVFKASKVAFAGDHLPANIDVPGNLTLHGVSLPVVAKLVIHENAGQISGELNFDIKLSDFKIDIPSFAGVTVAETVKVNGTFEMVTP